MTEEKYYYETHGPIHLRNQDSKVTLTETQFVKAAEKQADRLPMLAGAISS
jgi:hypothetical protein